MHEAKNRRGRGMAIKEKIAKKMKKEPKEIKGKKKKSQILDTVMDACAEAIFAWDEFQEIWEDGMKALGLLFIDIGAAIIFGLDKVLDKAADGLFYLTYHVVKAVHNFLEMVRRNNKIIVRYAVALVLVAVGLLAILNSATGYEYAYKGKTLGVVKDQTDVVEIVAMVSENLSDKYKTNISIDPEEDITFTRAFTLNRQIDNSDMVLSRLSNMTDAWAETYAIRIDGKDKYFLETKQEAQEVLDKVLAYYVPVKKQARYDEVGFIEDVKVVKSDTIVANIKSVNSVYKRILEGKKGEGKHKIKRGETISEIASNNHMTVKQIRKLNPKLDVEMVHAGQVITISKAVPSLSVKTVGVEKYIKRTPYKTIYKKSKSVYKGDTRVSRKGVKGKVQVTSNIVRKNGKKIKEEVISKKTISKPVAKIVLKGTKKRPPSVGSGHFKYPVHGASLTSGFGYRWGRMHQGIDLACRTGTPIYAADGGKVILAGWHYGYGLCVIIDHQNGYQTLYGHCSKLYVHSGSKVYKGYHIANVGNTGASYGSHCHFEIHVHGRPVNPMKYL